MISVMRLNKLFILLNYPFIIKTVLSERFIIGILANYNTILNRLEFLLLCISRDIL